MIIDGIKLPVSYTEEELYKAVSKASRLALRKIRNVRIIRRSIDARKKPQIFYVIKAAVNEKEEGCQYPEKAAKIPEYPVCVTGAGPAGLFAALWLLEAGIPVILLERGDHAGNRTLKVHHFWETGELDEETNVQFGEGGAGTFSDGKLNTLIKDREGYGRTVLRTFYEAGAPEEILYDAKPHIGTDILKDVIVNIRKKLLLLGADIRFLSRLSGFEKQKDGNFLLSIESPEGTVHETVSSLILATGHSARDTYELLLNKGVRLERKAFAIGIRAEHLQRDINISQYGAPDYEELGAAPYKVTAKTSSGRGVYSFCMCPGGYVVNASSENKHLAVNGMSYSGRDGINANSGIVVQISPEDFPDDSILSGVDLQRNIEKRAFDACGGKIPVQRYEDFKAGVTSDHFGTISPCMKGDYAFGNLREILPEFVSGAILEAFPAFGRMISGFDSPDTVLSAVESRTSSPVRITRDESFQSSLQGLYPCGEGAGYAGGIMSAAIDGIRTAKALIENIQTGEQHGSD